MSAYLAVIGECLVDVVHSETSAPKAHVGGSPFNVAVGLARLEHDVVFAGRRGDDDYGRMIARSLRAQGITALLEADASPTSVARATLDPTGQASYEFTLDWTLPSADELEEKFCALARETKPAAQNGDDTGPLEHLHAGSIGAMLQPGAETVKGVLDRARGVATISYDPNYRPTLVPNREEARLQAEEFIARADVIQASTDDLDLLYPERSHRETMEAWLQLGPALVIVTRGPSGAMGLTRAGFAEQEAFSIEVADTVGAGDSFMAATLSTLRGMNLLGASRRAALREISTDQLATVLRTAARAAAINSSRFGAQPPTADELTQALKS
ncbi:carbohydrate kinase [Nesterenkonia sp. LB17]|uniref:carbohydrate kinase family protein n=1 Tax=unclassified Nesterenkonia TaxID=2629769 RepID=UPI001F4CE89E|nr:carbohydrate kinase [Nesterenkonia sp. DZ6]MCH8563410.1 carbohydrate kinase [Nesterenkonia sp. YGD6]MCH8566060.1 carbohydrate kinase [Nesterenkonia sp. LB17]MCH8571060.1 carbohydrate kinase [Nesterenkonia sp. AY15]